MRRNRSSVFGLAIVAALTLQGCTDQSPPTEPQGRALAARALAPEPSGRRIVVFAAERVPADLRDRMSRLGGTVEASLDQIGVATVSGLTETAAAVLATNSDISAVESDRPVRAAVGPVETAEAGDETATEAPGPTAATASPTAAQFYARQWNMRAVFADQAWAAGHLGSRDVVIAFLDSGIDYTLPDFDGLVDLARSKSFVPEDGAIIADRFPGRLPISDLHGHGTAVASIAASNGRLLAGINRDVTVLAVKILNRQAEGSVAQFVSGLMYAADQGADVINMSGGGTFDRRKDPGSVAAIKRAANYASRKGAVLVAPAWNEAADLDHHGDLVVLPCEAPHVICASATAPTSTAGVNGPWVDVDAFVTSYSNYGRSAIDVAAPGGAGTFANPDPVLSGTQFRRIWTPCTTTPTEASFPACRRGQPITQPFGTSFSAPHVSGLAALLVAELGHGHPGRIRARIFHTADDLGAPGKDQYYGWGRINVARALGLLGGTDREESEDDDTGRKN